MLAVQLALRYTEHWRDAKTLTEQLTAVHKIDKLVKHFSLDEKSEFLNSLGKDHSLYVRYA